MTLTKRILMSILKGADDDAIIYADNGIDSMEFRAATLMVPRDGSATARQELYESVSAQEDGTPVPDGSVVLRLSN